MTKFLVDILSQVLAGIFTAGLLTAIAYIFKNRIVYFFYNEYLLPSKNIPDIKVEFEDVSSVLDKENRMEGFNLTNQGENPVSNLSIYTYHHSRKQTNVLVIKPLEHYEQKINSQDGKGGMTRLNVNIKDRMNIDGVFIQLTDENGIFFLINIYMNLLTHETYQTDYFVATPQGIRRLKHKLPNKILKEDKQILEKKYGIDIALG
ncbi:hypothetical protein [Enterococcus entomosocium]|uniref:hypothetical protein n=1 Tax=Enterococcus entomosocium TaxID=3034352 RepID=UPI003B59005C